MSGGHPIVRRRDAARIMFGRENVRRSLTIARQPFLRISLLAGFQVARTAAIALPLVLLSPWAHLVGFASLGALVALFGRFAAPGRRHRVVFFSGLLQISAVFVLSTAAWLGAPDFAMFALLALASGAFFFATVTGDFGPPGALIFVFAAGASIGPVEGFDIVLERSLATAAVALLALIICAATEAFRRPGQPDLPFPSEPLRPLGHRLVASGRVAIGSGLAVLTAHALGLGHEAWAAMGAIAVMQGTHLHITMNRAVQRMAGTVLGSILAWLILIQEPSLPVAIVILISLTVAIELVIGLNYGIGLVLVTPMALLMTYVATPGAAGADMAPERVMNTLLGVAIGLLVSLLLSSIDDRRRLAEMTQTG